MLVTHYFPLLFIQCRFFPVTFSHLPQVLLRPRNYLIYGLPFDSCPLIIYIPFMLRFLAISFFLEIFLYQLLMALHIVSSLLPLLQTHHFSYHYLFLSRIFFQKLFSLLAVISFSIIYSILAKCPSNFILQAISIQLLMTLHIVASVLPHVEIHIQC